MDFQEYQTRSRKTAIYPGHSVEPGEFGNWIYPALGLAGEAGEACDKLKKVIRDKEGVMDAETAEAISYELGDVLWYVSQLSYELGVPLDQIAQNNIEKLESRQQRGVLSGSGDTR